MSEPLVSIIVPCYNCGLHISDTLECLTNQTYKNIEIILVNDGSSDNTEEIIKSTNDKRIRYYCQENKGQCAASNFGLSKATGAYIKFFDSDDIMNPEHIEEQVKKIAGSTRAIASCAWGRFYNDTPASAKFVAEPVWKDMKPIDWLKTALGQKSDMMGAWLWLIPTKLIKKSGGWDERLSLNNDFEFSTRLLLHASDVLFTPKAKVYYRSGNNSALSGKQTEEAYREAFLSTQLGCSYLLNAERSRATMQLCANRYQLWIYRMYPYYPDLLNQFQSEIDKLGNSKVEMDGGVLFKFLKFIFGWKLTRRFQLFCYEQVYKINKS